ncbi:centriole, cilia and spindle-associated protein [Sinocyclocheilus rhinocerous]|uniref:Centriole, cilia and spindle-associated protein-like n=1 Tax=Sinocyclocheilus rhinocerous TaxID=307959 RepID=A0A673GAT0_9TELE|nr:PREDICTED: centriole, cilia and spindle-associated protein-like [Sinocyclocheilus rhinocerous]XP_016395770.1 PREDICTED: centriole, cilia and spindle-associated protein-like [Sinocyclocheilus rhinocerous]XP_016395778.1 PREDICTED: centriole, cilia and spindle-associated protein-like [Sinocyclocheilus rhinocerous]
MSTNNNMMSKKIRTEYMKKFRDPKWETFSKCYEDSVKYRLTRRLMEQTHRPFFVDGWDSGSDSSGGSSPKLQEGNVSNAKHYTSSSESKNENAEVLDSWKPQVNGEVHTDTSATVESSRPLENGYKDVAPNGPSESNPKRRQRRRAPRSDPCYPNKELDSDESQLSVSRKPSRAKSQPPGNTKERTSNRDNRRSFIHYDWAERHIETRDRRTPNMRASMSAGEIHRADVGVQTRREAKKGGRSSERRRAQSADPEKSRRSALSVADERWMTEYMRCFSARLR